MNAALQAYMVLCAAGVTLGLVVWAVKAWVEGADEEQSDGH